MAEPIPGKVHRHFKGDSKRYLVLGVGTHTESKEELVAYVPLYGENAGLILFRPLAMWVEDVAREDYSGPRFWPLPDRKPNLG